MFPVYIKKILILSALNSKEDELTAIFYSGLYHLIIPSGKNLSETTIQIDDQHKPSWFDLKTLNNSATVKTLKQMRSYFDTTNVGWLSKYVVDSDVSTVIAKSNKAVSSDKFGFLDFDST